MPTKSPIPWLLAALVLAAYSHCVLAHATEAVVRHHKLRTADQPLDDTRATCENESACICKGVTLAVGVEAPSPELGLIQLVGLASAAEFLRSAPDSFDRRIPLAGGISPILGRNMRAQLQCFLL